MKTNLRLIRLSICIMLILFLIIGCIFNNVPKKVKKKKSSRNDGAYLIDIPKDVSAQNPVWSPDGKYILFTGFKNGYNGTPSDLFILDLQDYHVRTLVSDGSGNVNIPGSAWNPNTHRIVFSSSREPHDEVYLIDEDGDSGDEVKITDRLKEVAYEPTQSPDGQWIVFESHQIDVEENGVIVKYKIGSSEYQMMTSGDEDCRQPNWSPAGDQILYQKLEEGQWEIWIMNVDGSNQRKITEGVGDKTDASFSPCGKWIVYSSNEREIKYANIFIRPISGGKSIRVTNYKGYDGAPSWSPDEKKIIFESSQSDPEDSKGTKLWIINVPPYELKF